MQTFDIEPETLRVPDSDESEDARLLLPTESGPGSNEAKVPFNSSLLSASSSVWHSITHKKDGSLRDNDPKGMLLYAASTIFLSMQSVFGKYLGALGTR